MTVKTLLFIGITLMLIIAVIIGKKTEIKNKEYDFVHKENNTEEENRKFKRILKESGGCLTEAKMRMRPNDKVIQVAGTNMFVGTG
jgi:hypothetical protein